MYYALVRVFPEFTNRIELATDKPQKIKVELNTKMAKIASGTMESADTSSTNSSY